VSAGELTEHLQYWQDDVKVDRYRRALVEVVRPGDTVLDLGSGTGLLGMLAVEAGAGRVLAVENGAISTVTAEVVERNHLDERIEVRQGLSTTLDLDEPVDVVVGDQIGGFVFSAGVLRFYADASRRLLRPEGTFVPGSFDLLLAPVQHQASRDAIDGWASAPFGYDLGPFHERAQNLVRYVVLDEDSLLGTPQACGTVAAHDDRRFRATLDTHVTTDGRLDGVAGMFVGHLSPSVTLSNVPGHPDRLQHRWQDLFPLGRGIDVVAGDRVEAEVVVNPVSYLTSWSIRVTSRAGHVHLEDHSTFEGALFDPAWFRIAAGRPVAIDGVARSACRVIADGEGAGVDTAAVVAAVRAEHPGASAGQVDRLVRSLVTLLADGPGEPQA
jgi:SAM-dependent methyltransferase